MKKTDSINKILVVRNDKIGDFILCLPSLHLLRACYPNAKIGVFVSHLTYELALRLDYLVDFVVLDCEKNAPKKEYQEKIKELKALKIDVSISLFSTFRSAKMLFLAGIKERFAPKTKLAQIFYNHKLTQRRSQSIQAEYIYNIELIEFFLKKFPSPVLANRFDFQPPFLKFNQDEALLLKQKFLKENNIEEDKKLVVIHPGDGGSATNFSINQYIKLANNLIGDRFHLVLSAGPNEGELVKKLAAGLKTQHYSFLQKPSLLEYAKHLQFADLMICGSTGPLHLASALNLNTCGFFPRGRVVSKTRWQPINDAEKQLLIEPDEFNKATDLSSINPEKVAIEISKLFLMI